MEKETKNQKKELSCSLCGQKLIYCGQQIEIAQGGHSILRRFYICYCNNSCERPDEYVTTENILNMMFQ